MINKGLIGWFQDAMEYGPRALGNRSIIAHPGFMDMQQKINMKINLGEGLDLSHQQYCEETEKFLRIIIIIVIC